jgi:hypothetical protein
VNDNIITYNTERLFFREILIILIWWGVFLLELFIEVCHNEIFERISFVVFGAAVYRPYGRLHSRERRKSERKNEKWLYVSHHRRPNTERFFC